MEESDSRKSWHMDAETVTPVRVVEMGLPGNYLKIMETVLDMAKRMTSNVRSAKFKSGKAFYFYGPVLGHF